MEIKEISVKNIIVKSKPPDADYVVNPYTDASLAAFIVMLALWAGL